MSLIVRKKEIVLQDCGGNLSKKWLIRYYILVSDKPIRQRETIKSSLGKEARYGFAKERIEYLSQFQDDKGHVVFQTPLNTPQQEPLKEEKNKLLSILNQAVTSKSNVLEKGSSKIFPPLMRYFKDFLKEKKTFQLADAYLFRNYLFEIEVFDRSKAKGSLKKLSKKRINNYLSALRELFTESVCLGLLKENPMQVFKNIKFETETQELYQQTEIKKIFEYLLENDK